MSYKECTLKLKSLLERKDNHSLKDIQTVSVHHIPYMGTRENFFLLINLLISSEIDRENLVNICVVVSRLAIESGLITNEKAVEVSIFSAKNEKTRRLIRVYVLDSAFADFLQVKNLDVLNNRFEGIRCQWPLVT